MAGVGQGVEFIGGAQPVRVRAGEGFEDRWLVEAGRQDADGIGDGRVGKDEWRCWWHRLAAAAVAVEQGANVSESDDAAASSVDVRRDPGEQRVSVGDEHPVVGDRVGVDRMEGAVDTGEIGRAGQFIDAESDDVWVLRAAGVGAGVDAAEQGAALIEGESPSVGDLVDEADRFNRQTSDSLGVNEVRGQASGRCGLINSPHRTAHMLKLSHANACP